MGGGGSITKAISDVASGDFLKNPLKSALSVGTLGLSDSVYDAKDALDEASKPMGSLEKLKDPPTTEDASKNLMGGTKTYGRMGTIKSSKGSLASNTLNLSSQTLTGN